MLIITIINYFKVPIGTLNVKTNGYALCTVSDKKKLDFRFSCSSRVFSKIIFYDIIYIYLNAKYHLFAYCYISKTMKRLE